MGRRIVGTTRVFQMSTLAQVSPADVPEAQSVRLNIRIGMKSSPLKTRSWITLIGKIDRL
jgi:hypothetical protein